MGQGQGAPVARLAMNGGMHIDLPARESWVLGRNTPNTPGEKQIDIDLTPYGGKHAGVSRRHARICRTATGFTIEDLGSHNETCINSERISPGQPSPLAHGDQVMLGGWRCTFHSK
jgi:pSer/pThr/pTyr-binding forkhead associated (FHA) protein